MGGGTEQEVKGRNVRGEGAGWEGGKVKGQLSLGSVVTSVVRERMGIAPAVQSGCALQVGRCASPPCVIAIFITNNE